MQKYVNNTNHVIKLGVKNRSCLLLVKCSTVNRQYTLVYTYTITILSIKLKEKQNINYFRMCIIYIIIIW